MRFIVSSTIFLVAFAEARARADTQPTSSLNRAQTEMNPPPTPPLPPPSPSPPAAAPLPPPGSYSYAPAYADPSAPNLQALSIYEHDRKDAWLAGFLSFCIPGVGNIYAKHYLGAVVSWGLIIGGLAIFAHANNTAPRDATPAQADTEAHEILLGLLVMAGGFVYGPIDAFVATNRYNRALAERLGLLPPFGLSVAPIAIDQGVAWGPALSFRF